MAYPVVKDHPIVANATVDGKLIGLQEVTQDSKPVVLDSFNGQPPFVVQHGFCQYHVLDNLDHMKVSRFQTYTSFKCANSSWQPCLDSLWVDEENRKMIKER